MPCCQEPPGFYIFNTGRYYLVLWSDGLWHLGMPLPTWFPELKITVTAPCLRPTCPRSKPRPWPVQRLAPTTRCDWGQTWGALRTDKLENFTPVGRTLASFQDTPLPRHLRAIMFLFCCAYLSEVKDKKWEPLVEMTSHSPYQSQRRSSAHSWGRRDGERNDPRGRSPERRNNRDEFRGSPRERDDACFDRERDKRRDVRPREEPRGRPTNLTNPTNHCRAYCRPW